VIKQNNSIIHTGLIEDTFSFYGLMNLFILPSYREGFPTVVLEASAMELPILTTEATGCIDSIIPNSTGMFIKHSKYDIAEKVKYYYNHPELMKVHGINGRKFIENNFAQEQIWEEIDNKLLSI